MGLRLLARAWGCWELWVVVAAALALNLAAPDPPRKPKPFSAEFAGILAVDVGIALAGHMLRGVALHDMSAECRVWFCG